MERFVELIVMQTKAEWQLFFEYWWLWLGLVAIGYFIIKE